LSRPDRGTTLSAGHVHAVATFHGGLGSREQFMVISMGKKLVSDGFSSKSWGLTNVISSAKLWGLPSAMLGLTG